MVGVVVTINRYTTYRTRCRDARTTARMRGRPSGPPAALAGGAADALLGVGGRAVARRRALARGPEMAAIDVPTSLLISGVLLTISLIALGRQLFRDVNEVEAAREIERCYPELNARLLAAVSQRRDFASSRLGYLQATVIGQALAHGNRTGWSLVAPRSYIVAAGVLQGLLLVGFGILLVLATKESHASSEPGSERSIIASAERYPVTIEPGDVEIERGTSLLVLRSFSAICRQKCNLPLRLRPPSLRSGPCRRALTTRSTRHGWPMFVAS